MLKFVYGYLHFLLYILAADIQSFSEHYKLVSFAPSAIKIWILEFDALSALALSDVHRRNIFHHAVTGMALSKDKIAVF